MANGHPLLILEFQTIDLSICVAFQAMSEIAVAYCMALCRVCRSQYSLLFLYHDFFLTGSQVRPMPSFLKIF